MMDIGALQMLQNDSEYQAALKAVRPYFETDTAADHAEAASFDALMRLIDDYETKHFEIRRATSAGRRR